MIILKSIKKYFCTASVIICILISFTVCSCTTENKENDNSNNTQITQPENTNYPVEGIWYSTVIDGFYLRDTKNNNLNNHYVEYCIWFMTGGGIKTKWKSIAKSNHSNMADIEWYVRDYTWKIDGYVVELSNDDKKIVIVDDKFTYQITGSYYGYEISFTSSKLTFSKVEDNVFKEKV